MAKRDLNVTAIEITEHPSLDAITVYFEDFSLGKGRITITCYGCAWTAYWGAMGGNTIKEFVASAGTDYLVTKLGITPLLKQRKSDHEYLGRIVNAVKKELTEPQ